MIGRSWRTWETSHFTPTHLNLELPPLHEISWGPCWAPQGCTSLSSWTPRAINKIYFLHNASPKWIKSLSICLHEDIHGVYYIVKNGNQVSWYVLLLLNILFLTIRTKIELKQLLKKWRWLKFQKTYKRYYQWLCVCKKKS